MKGMKNMKDSFGGAGCTLRLVYESHEAVKNVKGSVGFTKSVFTTFMSFMVICFS
jgi:hypothetical protein